MPIRVSATLADPPQLQRQEPTNRRGWNVTASSFAKETINPIRVVIEDMKLTPNPDKKMISLSIGDPTVSGHLKPCDEILNSVEKTLKSYKFNGYAASTGHLEGREAVAKYATRPGAPIEAKPEKPGGRSCRFSQNFTICAVVNNPSNPCGSVYTRRHLQSILEVAARNYVPIIADEIYEHFVFPGEEFYPIASLSLSVPILTCSGLTKRFLVPGWRMGWILIHDRNEVFGHSIRNGLQALCQRIMGSNTLVQGALPNILKDTPQNFFNDVIMSVKINASIAFSKLSEIPGLSPIMPSGAMYMMVGIDIHTFTGFKTDTEFVEKLVSEQSVMCLPGACFDYPNYVRLVLTVPESDLREACNRITEFCKKYSKYSIMMDDNPMHSRSTTLTPIQEDLPYCENNNAVMESPEPIRV
ncbi:tyrosine aminotransferase [Trichonephila inaurata madagascariensis]|uniref:Tyrosine aminotransferase n=1 Tax=Trichonephila inaurata madagascariensis TaxID=2747483 RepID=A0A8X6IG58_9ARAC|nr:tyrosine aminotransferase [Trichonephila inaurata madagascariensis]